MIMRRHSILSIILAFSIPPLLATQDSHNADATSQTYFSFLQPYTTGSPEHLTFYRTRYLERENGMFGSVQAVFFGGQTTDASDLARFFMPFGKSCMVVAEAPVPFEISAVPAPAVGGSQAFKEDRYDIQARFFDIMSVNFDFQSTVCFCPKQSTAGVAFNFRQSMFDDPNKDVWIDITVPVVHISNDIGLCEIITHSGQPQPGHPATVKEAFVQDAWKFGRISSCPLEKTGVADIEIRAGFDIIRHYMCRYSSFIGVIFPTGNRPEGKFLFEPIVGRAKHWGVSWGVSIGFEVWNNHENTIRLALDTHNTFLFENEETRAIDLKNKPWSRYITLFLDSLATTSTPGINVFTRKLKIKPRGTFEIDSAFILNHKQLEAEIGLHTFLRQSEEGELCQKWIEGPAIIGLEVAQGATEAQSMNLADMHNWDYGLISPDVDYSMLNEVPTSNVLLYKRIQETDLDIRSALHPAAFGYTLYAALGYNQDIRSYPTTFGIGASIQAGADNTIADRWSFWAKCALSL